MVMARLALVCLPPVLAQRRMQPVAELDRQLVRLPILVERDGLADVVHNDLTRITARQMFLKLLADRRICRSVHVLVQQR